MYFLLNRVYISLILNKIETFKYIIILSKVTRTFLEWFFGMEDKGLHTIVTPEGLGEIRVLEDKAGVHFRPKGENRDIYGSPLPAGVPYQFVPYRQGTAALLFIDEEDRLEVVSSGGKVQRRYDNVNEFRVMPFGRSTLVATTPVKVNDFFSQRNGAEVVHTSDFRMSIQCHEIGDVVNTNNGDYLPLRFNDRWKYMDEQLMYHSEIPQSQQYQKAANE